MPLSQIRSALETHLADLSGLPEIAWENAPYEPREGVSFIRVELQIQQERDECIGPDVLTLRKGLFLLVLFTPKNAGKQEADSIGDLLFAHFHKQTIPNGLYPIRINYVERRAAMEWKTWDAQNVVIGFDCFDTPS